MFLGRVEVVEEVGVEYVGHDERLGRLQHALGVVDEGRKSLHIVVRYQLGIIAKQNDSFPCHEIRVAKGQKNHVKNHVKSCPNMSQQFYI